MGGCPKMWLAIAVAVLALDQLTKWLVMTRLTEFQPVPVIPGLFSLQFVYNPGAAFSIFRDQRLFLILVAAGAVGGMLFYLREPANRKGISGIAMGLLIAGALGNMIDRIRFGKVVDFLLFYWKDWSFPNFNVADISINVGVGLLILYLLITGEKKPA